MPTATRIRESMAGAIILTVFGTVWLVLALANWRADPVWALPAAVIAGIALLVLCGLRIKNAVIVPGLPDLAAQVRRKQIQRPYWIIVGIEFAACGVSANVLARHGLGIWVPFAIALIVGVHFLPLAPLFESSIYYITGSLCVLGVLACLLIHDMVIRMVAVGFVMAAVLWMTVVVKLLETGRRSAIPSLLTRRLPDPNSPLKGIDRS